MNDYIAKILANLDKGLLLLLILPWLLLINNDAWLFDSHIMLDSWFYLGFFLRLEHFLEVHGGTYYASRMAWIIPGHIAFETFPPLVAQYLLHIGFYYLAVISIYLLLRRTVGYRSALLASVMMGCHSWFLMAIGSNYVDGAGIAYYSAAAFMLISATQESWWRVFLFLGGVFYGLAIYSNLSWLFLAPPLIFYYLFLNLKHRKNLVIPSSLFFILGLIAITLCLCTANFVICGRFLFFLPSLNFISSAAAAASKDSPHKPSWEWLSMAFWLMFMTITSVSGSVLILLSWLKKIPSIRALTFNFQVAFLLSVLTFVLLEALKNMQFLQCFYYASYLIPSTFIAVGGQLFQLESILNRVKRYKFWLIVVSIVVLTFVAYQQSFKPLILDNQANLIALFFIVLWLVLMVSAFLTTSQNKKTLRYALLSLLLSFSITNFVSTACTMASITPLPYLLGGPLNPTLNEVNFSHRHDAFLLNVDTQRYLDEVDPKVQLMFWYDLNEQWIYNSISYTSIPVILAEEFPRTGVELGGAGKMAQVMTKLKQNPNIVILSQKHDALEQAKRSLKKLGYDANLTKVHDMKRGELSFRMTFIKIYKRNT